LTTQSKTNFNLQTLKKVSRLQIPQFAGSEQNTDTSSDINQVPIIRPIGRTESLASQTHVKSSEKLQDETDINLNTPKLYVQV